MYSKNTCIGQNQICLSELILHSLRHLMEVSVYIMHTRRHHSKILTVLIIKKKQTNKLNVTTYGIKCLAKGDENQNNLLKNKSASCQKLHAR